MAMTGRMAAVWLRARIQFLRGNVLQAPHIYDRPRAVGVLTYFVSWFALKKRERV